MSVTAKDVEQVARLAELAVEPHELPALTEQLDRIVGFVAQLAELGNSDASAPTAPPAPYVAGPERAALRADVVEPADLARPPAALAPEFVDGFFVVPRLGAMEEEES